MSMIVNRKSISLLVIAAMLVGLMFPGSQAGAANGQDSDIQVLESDQNIVIRTEQYDIRIEKDGFKYSFVDREGDVIAPAHSESGIRFGSSMTGALHQASTTELIEYDEHNISLRVTSDNGDHAVVTIIPYERYAKFQIDPEPFNERHFGLLGEGAERVEALIWGGDTDWDNYTFAANMKQSRRDASSTSGIMVRYQDYNHFYHVRYHLGTNKLQLLKKGNGQSLGVITEATISAGFNSSRPYKIAVNAEGNRIRAYLDDTLLIDYTDTNSPILSGAVGMRVYSDVTRYSDMTVASGDTVLMESSEWEDMAVLNIHNGQWAEDDEQTGAAIIDARTAPLTPGYGLGDFAHNQQSTNVFGISNSDLTNKGADQRFVSNFTVFPAHGFAQVLFETGKKRVTINAVENKLGVDNVESIDALYYFMGSMEQIYADYQRVRVDEGYPVYKPKYDFFEVGYEAFGSLGWNTYQTSVMEDLSTYLDKGYRLKWGVVGSGFWKGDRRAANQGATTSFGLWDNEEGPPRQDELPNPRYPDVDGLKNFFRDNDMNLILGLRTNFKALPDNGGNYTPAHDGPFTVQGIDNGYFLSDENGTPLKYTVSFPSGSVHLLDSYNEDALDWYANGVDLWGADGYKEDTMMMTKPYQDGLWNRSNGRLMDNGYQVMVRNAAYSVPGDILRLEDTMHGYNQDRPIINALNYAASGAPNVYSDIVAGKYLTLPLTEDQKLYFVRNAMWAATTPAMSVGLGPWHMDNEQYEAVVKKAVDFHSMYTPYIYSAAIDSYHTGFPYTMTPLPIAYPDDPQTYQLANRSTRQYAWMLGPSMLAVSPYGQDYATVTARDVYLPEGKWIDFETGEVFNGPVTLDRYSLPMDKIPVFIGGKGTVVKRDLETESLIAEVYPIVKDGASYTFTYPDGVTTSTITNNNEDWNPVNMTLTDVTAGVEIDFEYNGRTGSYAFELTEGHQYELSGGQFDGAVTELRLPVDQMAELLMGERLNLAVEAVLDSGELADPDTLELVYESSQPQVAAISGNGEVTPLQIGEAMVRVSAASDSGILYSNWLIITVLEPELAITAPVHLEVLSVDPIVLSGTSKGLAQLEVRYNGIIQPIGQASDGTWTTAIGRLANGEYGIQIVGRDKNGLIRLARHVQVELNAVSMLMESRFDEPDESWSVLNGTWVLDEVDGRSVYRASGRGLAYAGDVDWRDYRLEADMRIAPSDSGGSAGIVFRYTDSGNFYHIRLDDNRATNPGTRSLQLYKWVSGSASKIAEAPFEFQYGQWYSIAVEAEGDSITAFVDGERLLEWNDSSLSTGAIGFRTYDKNTSFDQVVVSRLAPGETNDAVVWRQGVAQADIIADSELTIAWSGAIVGAVSPQYRVYVNNALEQTVSGQHALTIDNLVPGGLYSFKIEAGEGSNWSTDGPVAWIRMPLDGEDNGGGDNGGNNGGGDDNGNGGGDDNDNGSGGNGNNGGDGGSSGNEPEAPDAEQHVRVVTGAELKPDTNGEIVIELESGQTEVRLPANAAQLEGGTSFKLTGAGASVTIPSATFKSLSDRAGGGKVESFTAAMKRSAWSSAQQQAFGADRKAAGASAYVLEVTMTLDSGEEVRSDRFEQKAQIALEYNAAAVDAQLLGVYRFDVMSGDWIYVGGITDAVTGIIVAEVDQPGVYAVLERNKEFVDVVESHWAFRTLQILAARHIVGGVSEQEFAPEGLTTRAEFTALLVRTLGIASDADAEQAGKFGDVSPNEWYAEDVAAAYKAGLIQGVSEYRFAPNDQITREQMAVMIVRAFEYAFGTIEASGSELDGYADGDKLSPWAQAAVEKAVAAGLLRGKSAESFSPHTNATRAETAQAIYNMLELLRQ